MSTVEIMRCIKDALYDESLAQRLRDGDAATVEERYGLSPDESALLLAGDVAALTELDVHPFSLVQLSRVLKFDLLERWKTVAQAGAESGPQSGAVENRRE